MIDMERRQLAQCRVLETEVQYAVAEMPTVCILVSYSFSNLH